MMRGRPVVGATIDGIIEVARAEGSRVDDRQGRVFHYFSELSALLRTFRKSQAGSVCHEEEILRSVRGDGRGAIVGWADGFVALPDPGD